MRCRGMLLLWMLLLIAAQAQELRPSAFGSSFHNKTVIRVLPADGFGVRIRRPNVQSQGIPFPRVSTITRVQPILVVKPPPQKISLDGVLLQMSLRRMAYLIRDADLEQYLQELGSVTLFAPTDEAFSLVNPPKGDRLKDFILQHVVPGRIMPWDIRNDVTIPSLKSRNTPLRFNVYEDGQMLSVSGSQFLDDGQDAGQIRIQPIDRVLYPISDTDLMTEMRMTFPTMYDFLVNAALAQQLASGTFTLFAPTDEAFEALTPDIRHKLSQNPTLLRKVLLNHVVPGTHYSAVLAHGYSLRSLGGDDIRFTNRRGLILANGMPVVKSDISVRNGVIHAVNRLLLPPELHSRRKPATVAPPRTTTRPPPAIEYEPIPTYREPPPTNPRSLTKTMNTPLVMPDGRKETFTTANSLFRRSLLLSTIKNNGSAATYTIIMPTDGAFGAMAPNELDRMRRNTRLLRKMILCQMVQGNLNLTDEEMQKDRPIRSLGGTIIISSINGGKSLMVGGARVLSMRPAVNGIVLVTDRVAYPPPARSVTEALSPFPTLTGILQQQPKIYQTLSSDAAAYTVFAPTDIALSVLSPHQLQDTSLMNEIFWSHVVKGAYYRSRLSPGLQLTTLRDKIIIIQRTPSGDLLVNGIPVIGDEIIAGNGVIHRVDTLLFNGQPDPPHEEDTLLDIARQFNATQFLDWMKQAQMRKILKTPALRNRCTLFLPTNTALSAISPTLRLSILEDPRRLKKFIRFHISPQMFQWSAMRNDAFLPTLLPGKRIRCNVYAGGRTPGVMTVSGCRVSAVRPLDTDGNVTVAVVDETLIPPQGDLSLTIAQTPMLSNFSKILKVSGIEDLLIGGGPFTFFAPNACAFTEMDPDVYQRLISNRKQAREFVSRHLVNGCIYSKGLQDGGTLTTHAGTELVIQILPDCILVAGVKLLYGDMSCSDGVLHVLQNVLPL
ncbi:transforming growth factor-beta-induced protein ig-h3-like isoform X2 [Uloborus diversus]|uniref:transforming growth factor-beta-induced protein ig-h3-like isoform X2 n=1 Tax=Uloborus diversus TaxID=327109 RepID=UPI0024097EC8|nr:transforming growth factor-beta-induced protein ig-h3-like isoform X2 [Uloborus diversus]